MNKFKLAALTLSVIGTSALSLNTFASNFEDEAVLPVTAEIEQMITIELDRSSLTFDADNFLDGRFLNDIYMRVGMGGSDPSSKTYSITVTGDNGFDLVAPDVIQPLPMNVGFYQDRSSTTPIELVSGQPLTGQVTDLGLNSSDWSQGLRIETTEEAVTNADPGTYANNYTIFVAAE